MNNIRDMMQMKLTNLSIRLDAKLLCYFRDEIVCGITNSVYDTLYDSFGMPFFSLQVMIRQLKKDINENHHS